LREIPHTHVVRTRYLPGIRRGFAKENLQQSGLAGTVRTDQTDPVPWPNVKGNLIEEGPFTEPERNVDGGNHAWTIYKIPLRDGRPGRRERGNRKSYFK
jgi:hypothetical protein